MRRGQEAVRHPVMHRTPSRKNNYLAKYVHSVEAEKNSSKSNLRSRDQFMVLIYYEVILWCKRPPNTLKGKIPEKQHLLRNQEISVGKLQFQVDIVYLLVKSIQQTTFWMFIIYPK